MNFVHISPLTKQMAKGADVAKWIKAMDCGSITRGFNPRRSPIRIIQYYRPGCVEQGEFAELDGIYVGLLDREHLRIPDFISVFDVAI